MRVRVRLFASLRKYRPELGHGEAAQLELAEGATLYTLLDALGVPHGETKQCFVNATVEKLDHALADGDEVGLFPPIAGGGEPLRNPWQAMKKPFNHPTGLARTREDL